MASLSDKVALVAGGGTGIGRATALLFAREGARVVVFGRRPEPLREVAGAIEQAGGAALLGAFVLTKAAVPAMRAAGGGSIVHIGSAVGTAAVPEFSSYVASKAGLHQFAKAAAVEQACLYLASDHARYVTGAVLPVDGGWTAS